MNQFEKRVVGYLEQAGWRVVERADAAKINLGSKHIAYPEHLDGPVAGSSLEVAFYFQMERDFKDGKPGRYLTFPDKSSEAPEKEE